MHIDLQHHTQWPNIPSFHWGSYYHSVKGPTVDTLILSNIDIVS